MLYRLPLRMPMLYTNWPSTGNSFEGAFGGYDESGLWGNNSNYNADDTIGDDYDGDLRPRAVWRPHGI
eukprot:CAMPEP_0181323818 /NCGR_PEP_ID=MMETSP1101-20121128/20007_1 /TAXON_ID=46948 /ORGANISM="Rhodomonas abbreviata, Strain Caron Lab Isolate" /LENGTH=67 /DNA_ID=CAMNT_0023431909 /DNA_START=12 /DNA_END=215 /DNA_ORIENTATION=-